jgi:hypothetical protein
VALDSGGTVIHNQFLQYADFILNPVVVQNAFRTKHHDLFVPGFNNSLAIRNQTVVSLFGPNDFPMPTFIRTHSLQHVLLLKVLQIALYGTGRHITSFSQ